MSPCKRMRVTAMGINKHLRFHFAENYNTEECTGEKGSCGCKHAEDVLLERLADPVVVILSHSPCLDCAKLLHEANVRYVFFKEEYRKSDGIRYLLANNVHVDQI